MSSFIIWTKIRGWKYYFQPLIFGSCWHYTLDFVDQGFPVAMRCCPFHSQDIDVSSTVIPIDIKKEFFISQAEFNFSVQLLLSSDTQKKYTIAVPFFDFSYNPYLQWNSIKATKLVFRNRHFFFRSKSYAKRLIMSSPRKANLQ